MTLVEIAMSGQREILSGPHGPLWEIDESRTKCTGHLNTRTGPEKEKNEITRIGKTGIIMPRWHGPKVLPLKYINIVKQPLVYG